MAAPVRIVLMRYLQTRASVLRTRSVESLVNDLLPLAEFLTTHHPQVTTLRAGDGTPSLDRGQSITVPGP
jgi:hypothetical protein